MAGYLIRKFVPDYQECKNAKVRKGVGNVCGILCIILNLFLFASKYLVGVLVHSVSIRADAINNLTDAASNLVSIISFYLSEKPADKEHPYGHERTESITTLFTGIAIAFLGWETLRDSITTILHPSPDDFQWYTVFVLVLSIVIKLYMYFFNTQYGKKYHSSLLVASGVDARSDCLGTFGVLLSAILSPILHFDLDGYMGVVVSMIIMLSAFDLLKSVINALIGEAPDPKMAKELEGIVLSSDYVLGVHDLMIHTYGPTENFATIHAEVNGNDDIMAAHDAIDQIERKVKGVMGIDLTIHMDPILTDDPLTRSYYSKFKYAAETIGEGFWNIHDFRIKQTPDCLEAEFDLCVPFSERRTTNELAHLLLDKIHSARPILIQISVEHPIVPDLNQK